MQVKKWFRKHYVVSVGIEVTSSSLLICTFRSVRAAKEAKDSQILPALVMQCMCTYDLMLSGIIFYTIGM